MNVHKQVSWKLSLYKKQIKSDKAFLNDVSLKQFLKLRIQRILRQRNDIWTISTLPSDQLPTTVVEQRAKVSQPTRKTHVKPASKHFLGTSAFCKGSQTTIERNHHRYRRVSIMDKFFNISNKQRSILYLAEASQTNDPAVEWDRLKGWEKERNFLFKSQNRNQNSILFTCGSPRFFVCCEQIKVRRSELNAWMKYSAIRWYFSLFCGW